MTPAQTAFLRFHAIHQVVQWRWHFLGTQLRATSERGRSATLAKGELGELLEEGLLAASHGESVVVTELGRASLERKEEVAGVKPKETKETVI